MSAGAGSSSNSAFWTGSSGTGIGVGESGGNGAGLPPVDGALVIKDEAMGFPSDSGTGVAGGKQAPKKEPKGYSFVEHVEVDEDSDDDMASDSFTFRNKDIAPYAGEVNADGLLLPVSLLGLRDIPPNTTSTKETRMDVDTAIQPSASVALHPNMFKEGSMAKKILSTEGSLAFLQLPGLLALTEGTRPLTYGMEGRPNDAKDESSVAAAVAAAERMRGLGTDLRKVGEPGSVRSLGKLRFYKSGRVEIVMERGGTMDLSPGIEPKSCLQVVLIDSSKNTCEELESAVKSRLVATPNLGCG